MKERFQVIWNYLWMFTKIYFVLAVIDSAVYEFTPFWGLTSRQGWIVTSVVFTVWAIYNHENKKEVIKE